MISPAEVTTITKLWPHRYLAALLPSILLGILIVSPASGMSDIQQLIDRLASNDSMIRSGAMDELSKEGKRVLPHLEEALKTPGSNVQQRSAVVEILGRMGKPGVRSLRSLLRNGTGKNRRLILEAMRELGPKVKWAVPMLIDTATSAAKTGQKRDRGKVAGENFQVRAAALRAIGSIGPDAIKAVPKLIGLMKKPNNRENHEAEGLRVYAAVAYWEIKGDAKLPVKALITALKTNIKCEGCFQRVLRCLNEMGPAARNAVPTLKSIGRDKTGTIESAIQQTIALLEKEPS